MVTAKKMRGVLMKEVIKKLALELLGKKKLIAIVGGILIAIAGALLNLPEGEVKDLVCGKPAVELPAEAPKPQ